MLHPSIAHTAVSNDNWSPIFGHELPSVEIVTTLEVVPPGFLHGIAELDVKMTFTIYPDGYDDDDALAVLEHIQATQFNGASVSLPLDYARQHTNLVREEHTLNEQAVEQFCAERDRNG
ncbi:MAG: hypothetical protein AAGG72_04090 [Pseudomonadota bacterium]